MVVQRRTTEVLLGDRELAHEVLVSGCVVVTESRKGEDINKKIQGNEGYLTLGYVQRHSGNVSRAYSLSLCL